MGLGRLDSKRGRGKVTQVILTITLTLQRQHTSVSNIPLITAKRPRLLLMVSRLLSDMRW